jgi:hypothetical protein
VIPELLVILVPKVQLVILVLKEIPEPKVIPELLVILVPKVQRVIPELKVLTYEFAWHSRIPLLWMHG